MLSYPAGQPTAAFQPLLHAFATDPSLPFADVLSAEDVRQACAELGVDFASGPDDVWAPALTLWTFVGQCLSPAKSCVAAVARALVLRVALELPPLSAGTGAYCKARAKLPEALLRKLTLQVGVGVERQAPPAWRWHARRVLLADGTILSMPDTPDNQRAYPQPKSQKRGLGFPMIRLVVLLTFATATVVGAACGPCQGKESGETALFRSLLEQLEPRDVVVADRYYCSWWTIALLRERGADVVFRLHQRRQYDFRRGRRLGRGDHGVNWDKPPRPSWLDAATYAQLPDQLALREVRVVVNRPGYRVRELIVATSLTDAAAYPHKEIADLYHQRWHAELDLRNLKQTLRMDVLSCKSAAMIRKEIWAHLLGYNLIRKVLAEAALAGGKLPRQLSFAGALQTWQEFRLLLVLGEGASRLVLARALLAAVGSHAVGKRPGRVEPREVKRRRKVRLLTKPRAERRAELTGASVAAPR